MFVCRRFAKDGVLQVCKAAVLACFTTVFVVVERVTLCPPGRDDNLWRRIAERAWPQSTLRLSPYYQTYQVLNRA